MCMKHANCLAGEAAESDHGAAHRGCAGLGWTAASRVLVPWQQITGFEVDRPRGIWGGFCIAAVLRDGTTVDLMSTRA